MYIHITHCGSLWIKDRNRKRKKKEKPSQIRGLLAHQLNPFLLSVSLTTFSLDFCKIPEQPAQDTWSHVSWVRCAGAQYSCTRGISQCRDGAPCLGVAVLPHCLQGWEGDSNAPIPHPVAVCVENECVFACFLSRCYRGASVRQLTLHSPPELTLFPTSPTSLWHFYCPGSTTRSDAHPMLSSPPRTALVVQDPVTGTVLWPSRLPTSPQVEQWFAQKRFPVARSPGSHAQGFFQKLHQGQAPCRGITHKGAQFSEALQEHLKLPEKEGLLKINSTCSSVLHKEKTRLSLGCHGRVNYAEFRKQLYKEKHKEITQAVADRLSDFSRGLQWMRLNELFVAFTVYRSSWSQREFSCLTADSYSMAGLWCLSI